MPVGQQANPNIQILFECQVEATQGARVSHGQGSMTLVLSGSLPSLGLA